MTVYERVFGKEKPVIGMVHLKPLPSSPDYGGDLEEIYRAAEADLKALIEGGANAVIIENFGDIPYAPHNDLIVCTAFTSIATRLRALTDMPMGINIQFNDYEAEWAVAYSCNMDFIRVECFAESRVGPNGEFAACGPQLMRLKGRYPKDIALLCDVQVKHTFPLVDQPVDFTIESIIEGGGDALICTGITTGKSPEVSDVEKMKKMSHGLPVIVGSGVNAATVREFMKVADGAIIGSSFKKDGKVLNPIDKDRVAELMSQL
ncbi:MAG: BtpA/SgcQ family protein [Erysipelotrichaceae bacterium]|nr:BtpA/SgcQ family protein [Erysipelotrichaceae bacterium]